MMREQRVGIVGGGQLGMMLAEAAPPLGITVAVIDKVGCPASFAGAQVIEGNITSADAIHQLAAWAPTVTVEIEHINTGALHEVKNEGTAVHPSPETLKMIKDKYAQKVFLKNAGIPTADFLAIDAEEDFTKAGNEYGYPYVLKARHGAYDGRGNERVNSAEDLSRAREKLGDTALYAEKFVPFVKELAVMVARSTNGEIATYPVVETIHEKDILRYTLAPAEISDEAIEKAKTLARSVMEHLQGAGVFGIEMFLTADGEILINEIAPRVHNSGHYTIEGCETSQFTQHLLAITGRPLRNTEMVAPAAVMINILGDSDDPEKTLKGEEETQALGDVYVHLYHKKPKNPPDRLRKNGHITVLGNSIAEARKKADHARSMIHYG